ncbi:MAG: ABC transporter substrate-binding protein [Verrucomicrobiia bacterium]
MVEIRFRWVLALAAGVALSSWAAPAAPPQRVLSLCTTATDVLCALGAGKQLAAIDEYGRVVPEAAAVPVVSKGSALAREEVLARRVDLAFIWWYQDDAARLLEDLSVPVERICCARATDLPDTVRLIGRRVGREKAARRLADDLAAFLKEHATPSARPAPRVYLELYAPFRTVGSESYLDDLIALAGGANIAASISKGSVLLSAEQLVAADPDVILFVRGFTTAEAMARRPGLSGLRAVKVGRVVGIDRASLIAGSRLPEEVAHLRATLHPEN